MSSFKPNKNEIVHAAVVTSQKVVELMGRDLTNHFMKHSVHLLNITPADSYGPDAVTLVLAGREINIKRSLSLLKKVCLGKELGIEQVPIHSLPPNLKGYLLDIEDNNRFNKLFSFCSKEYLDYCKANGISPHPEVLEQSSSV